MSETPKIEIQLPEAKPPDFREALHQAIANAPLEELAPSLQSSVEQLDRQTAYVARFKDLPDSAELAIHHKEKPSSVSTSYVKEYPALLEQAWEALVEAAGFDPYTEEQKAAITAKYVEHETQHGAALLEVNPDIAVHYGVDFSKTILPGAHEPSFTFAPFFAPEGTMRKIDYATGIAGPDELSENDRNILNGLGYDSAEEVAAKRAALEAAKHAQIGDLALQSPDQPQKSPPGQAEVVSKEEP